MQHSVVVGAGTEHRQPAASSQRHLCLSVPVLHHMDMWGWLGWTHCRCMRRTHSPGSHSAVAVNECMNATPRWLGCGSPQAARTFMLFTCRAGRE